MKPTIMGQEGAAKSTWCELTFLMKSACAYLSALPLMEAFGQLEPVEPRVAPKSLTK